ncbi:receptor-like protein 12 [Durio zibethinus]|uniref:Receptor-like protein 12 n=1 Tax=Durio zibethinus TaxID=66656 RepID=A0A6P5Y526_DURZI|nr:receptor-like protein 12 [Durio zibethinus]
MALVPFIHCLIFKYLSLPSCNVSEFPQFLRGSKSSQYLDLSNNSLSGNVSSLICKMTSLQFLDLSHNNLSGIIPHCLGNLSDSLWMLNLQMNKFYGIIPPTFTKGCQLKSLNLNGNQLEGPLTRSILNCRGPEVLDLGDNKINVTFPHWLGSLPELQVLVLRSNQLHGSIQDNRSGLSFSKIQIFDISSNSFSGALPVRYLKNFKAMINLTKDESAMQYIGSSNGYDLRFCSYSIGIVIKGVEMEVVKIFTKLTTIDLSNNKFRGEIPKVIGNLNSLKGLNLSHNNLSGSIPTSIGNLIGLEWLDLSSNKLVGTIPERLLDLTSLSVFNVSENHLQGQVPQGKQFNTFENDSYDGNEGLCGFPVSKGCSNSKPPPSNLLEEDCSK